ncbi:hypothetical protein C8R44DRAFT_818675 [Mycena epipterygia]|nr:hypothetical protein C8R44DRAFT_818675 [Mycena epipterygia]
MVGRRTRSSELRRGGYGMWRRGHGRRRMKRTGLGPNRRIAGALVIVLLGSGLVSDSFGAHACRSCELAHHSPPPPHARIRRRSFLLGIIPFFSSGSSFLGINRTRSTRARSTQNDYLYLCPPSTPRHPASSTCTSIAPPLSAPPSHSPSAHHPSLHLSYSFGS